MSDQGCPIGAHPSGRDPDGCASGSSASRSRQLIIPLEQSLAIHDWVADGAEQAADALTEIHAVDTTIVALETHCSALGDLGDDGAAGHDDALVAGVLLPFRGTLCGAALLSMDPEDALAWARADSGSTDPVATYLEIGGRILSCVIEAASRTMGVPTEVGQARLEESSLVGCLLATHAPSDTVLIRTRVEIEAGHQQLPAEVCLLMEPKIVSTLLGALSVAMN